MGFFENDDDYRRHEEAWRTVEQARLHPEHHQAKLSHELISGAAAFAAAKMYEHHLEKEGKPVDHANAKALLAGFAGFYIDKLVETKGADAWEGHKNKEEAKAEAARHLEQQYTAEAHERWNAEHDHWHAQGGPQGYAPPPPNYGYVAPGFMTPQQLAQPYYPNMPYAPPPMGYAPGWAPPPPPMAYAQPGYAPPGVVYEQPVMHHHGHMGRMERREERMEERREERREGFGFGRGRHERW
ncbi:hypothetical protein FB45DRAFT_301506 [Roridomyces roridus]|uniref:Uncharacterized protein n=1 Tax=Roridomyces roridus TaxID=1738132 RepID=A0AAD7FFX2_9AGAR|nr:hypothetical protein FB45DRAFT_934168 [Roridomyces roridus]KAJ7644997.1 hypothetical protein FB45DRAFT_301506 [Roridomyces roridus]